MKKLTIVLDRPSVQIKGWEKFSLIELLELAGIFTTFVSKRFQFCQEEIDDKFKEYKIKNTKIGNRNVKEYKLKEYKLLY